MTVKHPHYGILAGRIAVSNLHKETKSNFSGLYSLFHIELSQHKSFFCRSNC